MGGSVRVFFALWPDDGVRRALHAAGVALQQTLSGRLTRAPSIHMTLLFLGQVEEARLAALHAAAAGVRVSPFSMSLDRAACWRHNRIGWLGPTVTPAALGDLARSLRVAVEGAGFAFDHQPFAPHVTLVRDATCRPLAASIAPIEWPVRDLVLVRSRLEASGSRYETIGRWGGA